MASKSLVTVAAVVAAIAVMAVAVVMLHEDRRPAVPSPGTESPAATGAKDSGAVKQQAKPKLASARPGEGAIPAEASSETAAAETPAAAAPGEAEAKKDAASPATTDPEAFVASLSDAQSSELYRLLRQKSADRYRREARYNLLTDTRLQFLEWGGKPDLALSDAQKKQIAALKEGYKPQLDALLAVNWAKQEEVNQKIQEAQKGVKGWQDQMKFYETNKDLFLQQQELAKEADEIAKPVDEQYQLVVRTVLTPMQAKELDDMHVQRQGGAVSVTRGSTQGMNVIVGGSGGGPVVIQGGGGGK